MEHAVKTKPYGTLGCLSSLSRQENSWDVYLCKMYDLNQPISWNFTSKVYLGVFHVDNEKTIHD